MLLIEMKIVTKWLEGITEEKLQVFNQDIQWLNTLHSLQLRKDTPASLDPDAPIRETKLHADDSEEEKRLNKQIWELIRAGKFQEAIQFCRNSNQFWKASSFGGIWIQSLENVQEDSDTEKEYSPFLQGTQLYHDALLEGALPHFSTQSHQEAKLSGNPFRSIWRYSCFQLASSKYLEDDIYQRAIYGLLCGHLPAILPVCRNNWMDSLWAHFMCLIDSKFEKVNSMLLSFQYCRQ